MIIALASPRVAVTLDDGLEKVRQALHEASAQGAVVVCFPEAYLPGLRGVGIKVLPWDEPTQERVLQTVAQWAQAYGIATILGISEETVKKHMKEVLGTLGVETRTAATLRALERLHPER